MAARRRTSNGRFLVLLITILALGAVIFYLAHRGASTEAVVEYGAVGDARSLDAIVMRNEQLVASDGYARIIYVAEEGDTLKQGETVAYAYTAGYSEREMDKLEQTRRDISNYYKSVLSDILDNQLESLNAVIENYAAQLQTIVRREDTGNLLIVQRQLEEAMAARQEYLRTSKREDSGLSALYDRETQLENSISSWRTEYTAPIEGTVSFYLDGYEGLMNPANYDSITPDQLHEVLRGQGVSASEARGKTPLFRVVQRDSWSVVVMSSDNWSPAVGQTYTLQIKGMEDYIYQATISSLQKNGNETIARMDVYQDAEPIMHVRTGKAIVGSQMTGLRVPKRAIFEEGGGYSLHAISDTGSYASVPVNVTMTDDNYVLVEGQAEGTVYAGLRVLLS